MYCIRSSGEQQSFCMRQPVSRVYVIAATCTIHRQVQRYYVDAIDPSWRVYLNIQFIARGYHDCIMVWYSHRRPTGDWLRSLHSFVNVPAIRWVHCMSCILRSPAITSSSQNIYDCVRRISYILYYYYRNISIHRAHEHHVSLFNLLIYFVRAFLYDIWGQVCVLDSFCFVLNPPGFFVESLCWAPDKKVWKMRDCSFFTFSLAGVAVPSNAYSTLRTVVIFHGFG